LTIIEAKANGEWRQRLQACVVAKRGQFGH